MAGRMRRPILAAGAGGVNRSAEALSAEGCPRGRPELRAPESGHDVTVALSRSRKLISEVMPKGDTPSVR
jgi:hypothetical protein